MDSKGRLILLASIVAVLALVVGWSWMSGTGGEGVEGEAEVEDALLLLTQQADAEAMRAMAERQPDALPIAIRHLADRGTPEAYQALRAAVNSGAPDSVRAIAAGQLGRFDDIDVDGLAMVARGDASAEVRAGATRGLAGWSNAERDAALPTLLDLLSDPDPRVRNMAITGVSKATGMIFEFDAAAEPYTQAGNIQNIRRRLGK